MSQLAVHQLCLLRVPATEAVDSADHSYAMHTLQYAVMIHVLCFYDTTKLPFRTPLAILCWHLEHQTMLSTNFVTKNAAMAGLCSSGLPDHGDMSQGMPPEHSRIPTAIDNSKSSTSILSGCQMKMMYPGRSVDSKNGLNPIPPRSGL